MQNLFIKKIALKGISLFLYLNAQKIVLFLIALYFTAIFILSPYNGVVYNLKDWALHAIIWASTFSLAAGFLIHFFYTEEKEIYSNSLKANFSQFISKKEYLYLYLFLNILSLIVSSLVSYKVFIYFVIYQFALWFYSHKLNKFLLINNISKEVLTIIPFFALYLHYGNSDLVIIIFGVIFFFLLLLKDIIKDHRTFISDTIFNFKTIPNTLGANKTKYIVLSIILLMELSIYYIFKTFNIGILKYYYIFLAFILGIILFFQFYIKETNKNKYYLIEFLIKLIIIIGIFSIPFIDWNPINFIRNINI